MKRTRYVRVSELVSMYWGGGGQVFPEGIDKVARDGDEIVR